MSWTPDSWRARPIAQQPAYEDDDALRAARAELAALPPDTWSGWKGKEAPHG